MSETSEGINLEAPASQELPLINQENEAAMYVKQLLEQGVIQDPEMLSQYNEIFQEGTKLDKPTMTYRLAGDKPEDTPHDATQLNFRQLQQLETLAQDKEHHPDAEIHFNNLVNNFAAKVTGVDGTQHTLTYQDYTRWLQEERGKGTALFISDIQNTTYTNYDETLSAKPESPDEPAESLEQEDPKEVRKKEILEDGHEYYKSMKAYLEADKDGVQFCKTEGQQRYVIGQIKRYYGELAEGSEITDELVLRLYHRDNYRDLYSIQTMIEEEHKKQEAYQNAQLLEELQADAALLNGEQEMLEAFDELKGLDRIGLADETRGLFKDREESSRFRQMRRFVRENGEKLKEYREIFEKNIQKEKIKGIAVNSALMIGFLAFLIGSQVMQGEGQPQQ